MHMKRHLKPVRIIILFLLMTAVFALSATTANAAAAPSQVTGVKLKAGEFKVTLSWNRVANAHGYVIYYNTTNSTSGATTMQQRQSSAYRTGSSNPNAIAAYGW